jgi:hypothetical protein
LIFAYSLGNRVQIRGRLQRREHRHLIDLRGPTRLGTILQAGDPASVYHFFKTITVCSDTPTRSTISFIPTPSSANNTIHASGTKPAHDPILVSLAQDGTSPSTELGPDHVCGPRQSPAAGIHPDMQVTWVSVPHAAEENLSAERLASPVRSRVMSADEFVPVGFDPPTSLATDQFRLEPLGPQHNQADHAAWMSSIEHIRSTPGYPDGNWPPRSGMTLEENPADLGRHADDFTRGAGFTFTVLDPGDNDVIGCVYLYPSASEEWDVTVQSWVRADRSGLDVPLADTVARWLATDWPWGARGPPRSLSRDGTLMAAGCARSCRRAGP